MQLQKINYNKLKHIQYTTVTTHCTVWKNARISKGIFFNRRHSPSITCVFSCCSWVNSLSQLMRVLLPLEMFTIPKLEVQILQNYLMPNSLETYYLQYIHDKYCTRVKYCTYVMWWLIPYLFRWSLRRLWLVSTTVVRKKTDLARTCFSYLGGKDDPLRWALEHHIEVTFFLCRLANMSIQCR